MAIKRIRLPKDGVVESDDRPKGLGPDTDNDVEGHGFFNPAPPAGFSKRSPSSGGDAIPSDDDTEADPPA